jgi:hypothetical protein
MTYDQLLNEAQTKANACHTGGGSHFGRFGVFLSPIQSRMASKMWRKYRTYFSVDGQRVTKEEFAAAWQADGNK